MQPTSFGPGTRYTGWRTPWGCLRTQTRHGTPSSTRRLCRHCRQETASGRLVEKPGTLRSGPPSEQDMQEFIGGRLGSASVKGFGGLAAAFGGHALAAKLLWRLHGAGSPGPREASYVADMANGADMSL
eukprot:scaffold16279_cov13-Prasinocladus_malaysianus.AAC.1